MHLAVHRVCRVRRHPQSVGHDPHARWQQRRGGRGDGRGVATIALGSDGGGSIRIPSSWCGVFGIKPQRDRVPLAPHLDSWYGLDVNGPLTRTVEDAALFLDVTTQLPPPDGGFVAAAARSPGRLRIALSTKAPPPVMARLGKAQRAAVNDAGALMRDLGHEVGERDPDYPAAATLASFMPRYLRGIRDDVGMLSRPECLEARTRSLARMGALISDRRIAAVREREPDLAARVLSIFDDVDVVVTPATAGRPFRIGAFQRRGAIATLRLVSS